jgi:hypothetical protein
VKINLNGDVQINQSIKQTYEHFAPVGKSYLIMGGVAQVNVADGDYPVPGI